MKVLSRIFVPLIATGVLWPAAAFADGSGGTNSWGSCTYDELGVITCPLKQRPTCVQADWTAAARTNNDITNCRIQIGLGSKPTYVFPVLVLEGGGTQTHKNCEPGIDKSTSATPVKSLLALYAMANPENQYLICSKPSKLPSGDVTVVYRNLGSDCSGSSD